MLRWRKSWTLENLQGSIRKDLLPSERSVWADLLDLCALSRRWGVIERSEGIPYTEEELAQMFITPVDVVKGTISKSLAEGRLQKDGSGALIVSNWGKYQAKPTKEDGKGKNSDMERQPKRPKSEGERDSLDLAAAMRIADKYPEVRVLLADPTKQKEAIDKLIELNKKAKEEQESGKQ